MSNIKYLKGVRTRYIKILKSEVSGGFALTEINVLEVDKIEALSRVSTCLERLQAYAAKLEIQSEKVATAIDESDDEFTNSLVEEDTELCDSALTLCSQLKHVEKQLNESIEQEEHDSKVNVPYETKPNVQEEMQKMLEHQLHMQREFFEKCTTKQKQQHISVKLPKLEISSFSGNKLRWMEFWQSFENSVHKNDNLCNIDKFNYLRSKLSYEARDAIAGISLSNENYEVAIDILKDRFGNVQETIDLHYNKMINLEPASDSVESLRRLHDTVETHLRSLDVLKQNVNQDIFVSVIKSKLPSNVIRHLEIQKGAETPWTVFKLCGLLKEYVLACEKAEKVRKENLKPVNQTFNKFSGQRNHLHDKWRNQRGLNQAPMGAYQRDRNKSSAETLVVNDRVKSHQMNKLRCRYCSYGHWSDECPRYKTIDERKRCLRGSCYRCLKDGHTSNDCRSRKVCVYCNEMNVHHRSLCPKKFKRSVVRESVSVATEEETVSYSLTEENALLSSSEIVFMQTARTRVKGTSNGKELEVRILLDSGSQRTYITEELATSLGLKQEREQEIRLVTFGSEKAKVIKTATTKINLQLKNGVEMKLSANIVPRITGSIQRKPVNISDIKTFSDLTKNLSLADTQPTETETGTIDILIGNDYYLDIILGHKIELQPGLYLLSSRLGWILTGRTNDFAELDSDVSMLILTYGNNITKTEVFTSVDESLHRKPDLEDFWKLESIGISDDKKTSDDDLAMKNFQNTLTFKDDRYHVTWPWKNEIPDIPNNRALAVGRLKSLLGRLHTKPKVLEKYNEVIEDQLQKQIIEKVERTHVDGILHYIPHHAVIKPDRSTTKLRIVYDASAKTKAENRSLNECLYRGPVLIHDLCGTLLRFRLHKIGIVADIEKAFLQICLQPTQRDVTRFLWFKDLEKPSMDAENIQEYRFCRVPFGVISSPFLLGATVDYHLDSYNTLIAKQLKKDIYMDNVITGTNSVSEGVSLYTNSKQIFSDASMNLREWASNSETFISIIPDQDRAKNEGLQVLGLSWNRKNDTIGLKKIQIQDESVITKRTVLKQVAAVFDPLGLFAPVTLKGKLLLQNLWIKHVDWDENLSEEDVQTWLSIRSDLIAISSYQLPRCVTLDNSEGVERFLVCFCDASCKAYCASVYLVQHSKDKRKSELIFSKTRLAPTKSTTIPRLELMAVVIGARCVEFVRSQLSASMECTYIFTDSQCTLQWITSTKQLSVFVRNRVQEIKSHSDVTFCYVDTKTNPADIASRGSTLEKLIDNHLWWHGPNWLMRPKHEWHELPVKESASIIEQKVRNDFETEVQQDGHIGETTLLSGEAKERNKSCFPFSSPFEIDIERYSSLTKLLRVTATVVKAIERLKGANGVPCHLTKEDLEKSEQMWVLHVQRNSFDDVFQSIEGKKPNNLQRQLGVYLEDTGILKCKGRLENACLTESARFPVLLPNKSKFTHLLILHVHGQILHSGVSQTLSKLRHTFWIPHGRAIVRKMIHRCLVCRRIEGGPFKMPPMAPLPYTRVSESIPFSHTGLDYMGPLYVKEEGHTRKVWVCLFTCMVTRSVHLEMVSDMSTNAFLQCLRRFIALRGAPTVIVCDNAMQFKLASETIELVWKNIFKCEEVQSYSANERIKWNFIVELSPWMGGFYERLVGLIKRSLRKAIGRKLLECDQLRTVLSEAGAVVNSRPLVYVGDDINSTIVITPGHFLCLNPKTGIPACELSEKDPDFKPRESSAERLLQIWKKGQILLDAFWNIWRQEYLTSLRERAQTKLKTGRLQSKECCNKGDIVLVKDNVPRGSWRFGRVVELIQSADGCVRSAKVQTQSGSVMGRPLCLLYPLETSTNTETTSESLTPIENALRKPQSVRKAAKHANEKNKGMFERRVVYSFI